MGKEKATKMQAMVSIGRIKVEEEEEEEEEEAAIAAASVFPVKTGE
jgi:hypothetical protein